MECEVEGCTNVATVEVDDWNLCSSCAQTVAVLSGNIIEVNE